MSQNDVHNIEPTRENPRSSEGAFVTLSNSQVLFVYTQFYGGTADESPARLVGIESGDGGKSWSAPREILANDGGNNVMSVSLLRLKSGRIALFYLKKNSWIECLPYVRFSDDEAKTWSAPALMTAAPGYFVLNNDRVVQLSSGRLVAPLAFHRSKGTDPHSSRSFDARAMALWALFDDEGKTWREARSWWALPVASGAGLQEPGVVELADGTLFCFARTDKGTQYEMLSADKGETWSAPVAGPLASPLAPASIKRLPNRLIALYNDHSGHVAFVKGKRAPLTLALSDDGGKSWHGHKEIETDPDGWYCYTGIAPMNGSVFLTSQAPTRRAYRPYRANSVMARSGLCVRGTRTISRPRSWGRILMGANTHGGEYSGGLGERTNHIKGRREFFTGQQAPHGLTRH